MPAARPRTLEHRHVKAAGLGVDAEGPGTGRGLARSTQGADARQRARPAAARRRSSEAHEHGVLVGGARRRTASTRSGRSRMGVDVIVAQGTEAGGHCGEISTMVLVPEVVDAVGPDVPVLAAGGIGIGPPDGGRARARRAGRVDRFDLAHRRREPTPNPLVRGEPARGHVARHRAVAGDDGQAGAPAAHRRGPRRGSGPTRPTRCRCRCRACSTASAARRITRGAEQGAVGLPRRPDRRAA